MTDESFLPVISPTMPPLFNPQAPTGMLLGRFQPFHDGHRALALEVIRRVGQVAIMVRMMQPSRDNPFTYDQVKNLIERQMEDQQGRFIVLPSVNVVTVFHGRDTGWNVQRIDLDPELEKVSATAIREKMIEAGVL